MSLWSWMHVLQKFLVRLESWLGIRGSELFLYCWCQINHFSFYVGQSINFTGSYSQPIINYLKEVLNGSVTTDHNQNGPSIEKFVQSSNNWAVLVIWLVMGMHSDSDVDIYIVQIIYAHRIHLTLLFFCISQQSNKNQIRIRWRRQINRITLKNVNSR